MERLILQNQIAIMWALISITPDNQLKKDLRDQIAYTKARLNAMVD